mgnify:CR=1 FL=1
MLNLNGTSKLQMMNSVASVYNVDRKILPQYAESVDVLLPISKLLEGVNISPQKANKILAEKGVLIQKTRTSKSSKTGKGLFGIYLMVFLI